MLLLFVIIFGLGALLFGLFTFGLFASRHPVGGSVFGVIALFCLLTDVKLLQFYKMTSGGDMGMPPTTVTSAEVKQENWPQLLSAVGSISPVQGAMISSELPGTVAQVGFESGAMVKKGDLLVRLDTS